MNQSRCITIDLSDLHSTIEKAIPVSNCLLTSTHVGKLRHISHLTSRKTAWFKWLL